MDTDDASTEVRGILEIALLGGLGQVLSGATPNSIWALLLFIQLQVKLLKDLPVERV